MPIHLQILQEHLTGISGELMQVRFSVGGTQRPWRPRINLYRCPERFMLCVELAGIDRSDIDLQVEPRRVWLYSRRRAPRPEENQGELLQIQVLEIDEGPCTREILLPCAIRPEEVHAEQRNGLLWINLPLRNPL